MKDLDKSEQSNSNSKQENEDTSNKTDKIKEDIVSSQENNKKYTDSEQVVDSKNTVNTAVIVIIFVSCLIVLSGIILFVMKRKIDNF